MLERIKLLLFYLLEAIDRMNRNRERLNKAHFLLISVIVISLIEAVYDIIQKGGHRHPDNLQPVVALVDSRAITVGLEVFI